MAVVSLKNKVKSRNMLAGNPPNTLSVTGYSLWLDAADASTFTFSSGTVVSEWRDKSSNAYNFAQSTVSKQPQRNATQNGYSVVVFDGVNDTMVTSNASAFNLNTYTIFIVTYCNDASNVGNILSKRQTGAADDTYGSMWYSGKLYGHGRNLTSGVNATLVNGSNGFWIITTDTSAANTGSYRLLSQTMNNSVETKLWFQGANLASATAGSQAVTNSGQLRLGSLLDSSQYLNGTIAEIIIYSSVLSDANRQTVETYLKNKWGIV